MKLKYKIKKIKLSINLIFRFLLLIAGAVAIYNQIWINLFLIILTFIITFLPSIIEKNFALITPMNLKL